MRDEIISFATAKIAREKGVSQHNFNASWYNEFGVLNGRTDLNSDGLPYPGAFIPAELKPLYKREKYSAQTQTFIQRWLREEHSIHIMVDISNVGTYYPHWYQFDLKDKNNVFFFKKQEVCKYKFSTYEAALEEGILEAFKLI